MQADAESAVSRKQQDWHNDVRDIKLSQTMGRAPAGVCVQIAALIEACLQRNVKARPTAKQIFDFLLDVLSRPQSNLPPLLETTETQKAETPTTELEAGRDSIFLTAEDIGEENPPPADKSAHIGGKAPGNEAAQQQ